MKIGDAPNYLIEELRYVGDVQPYNLRNNYDFRLQCADTNTNATQRSLFYKGLKNYNMIHPIIKNETNINIFRKKIVNFIRNTNVN